MGNIVRVVVVLACVIAAAASASAPGKHNVERAMAVPVGYEQTWTTLIDLFADRVWPIDNLDKASGLITTDWMWLGERFGYYADCGGSGTWSVRDTQIKFNVRVKADGAASALTVNASFRQTRSWDTIMKTIECTSRGTVEEEVHHEIAVRNNLPTKARTRIAPVSNRNNDPKLATAYWCSHRDGLCSAEEAACDGFCNKTDEVWCAHYRQAKGEAFLCGSTRAACLILVDNPQHRRGRSFGECTKQKPSGVAPQVAAVRAIPVARPAAPASVPAPVPASAPPPPRGHFCSLSAKTPAAGICTREKIDCQRARDAALAAVADLDECRLTESAFCRTADGAERCAPTAAACEVRAGSAATACAETR